MKVSIVVSLLASLALAQTSTSSSSSTSSAPQVSLTPAQQCLSRCSVGDVNCAAQCVGTPNPNSGNINDTTECIAKSCTMDHADDCYLSCINKSYSPSSATSSSSSSSTDNVITTTDANGNTITTTTSDGETSTDNGAIAAVATAGFNAALGIAAIAAIAL